MKWSELGSQEMGVLVSQHLIMGPSIHLMTNKTSNVISFRQIFVFIMKKTKCVFIESIINAGPLFALVTLGQYRNALKSVKAQIRFTKESQILI